MSGGARFFELVTSGGKGTDVNTTLDELRGQIAAINKSQAVIEFALDGTILTANENFLHALGYTLSEIQGKHHRLFVDPAHRESADYRAFWAKLARGEYDAAVYKRMAKGGREVWIQASYNPIMNAAGKPYKVVKYATDITDDSKRPWAKPVKSATASTTHAPAARVSATRKAAGSGASGDAQWKQF